MSWARQGTEPLSRGLCGPLQLPPAVPRSSRDSEGCAIRGQCSHVAHDAQGEQAREQVSAQHINLSTSLAKCLICCSLLIFLELFSLQIFCFSTLFLPLKLLLNIIPHVYSLLFFQAESYFIVSSSYFLLLSRSLCNISLSSVGFAAFSRPGSLGNGENKSHKPVPSFLPFPIYTEWSQFHETLAILEAQCPLSHRRAFNPCESISVQPEWPDNSSHWGCNSLLCLSNGDVPIVLGHVPQNTTVGSSEKASGEPAPCCGCSAPNTT